MYTLRNFVHHTQLFVIHKVWALQYVFVQCCETIRRVIGVGPILNINFKTIVYFHRILVYM